MAVTCDPQTLANDARCFARCIPQGGHAAVQTYLLALVANNLAGTSTDPNTLANLASGFRKVDGFQVAIQDYLLCQLVSGCSDPSTLANNARCFSSCIPYGELGAVETYLLAQLSNSLTGSSTDASTLMNLARCFECYSGFWAQIQTYLICQIVNNASSGSGSLIDPPIFNSMTLSADGTTVTASWTATTQPTLVNGTEVWASTDGVTYSLNATVMTPATTYTRPMPPAPAVLYMKLRFTNGASSSAFSAAVLHQPTNTLLTNLVDYWTLDEVGNSNRVDSISPTDGNLQLTSNGSMSNVAGIIDQAASSGGVGTLGRANNRWSITAGDSFTISIWVRILAFAGGFRGICTYYNGVNISYFLWHNNTGDITYTTQPAGGGPQTNNLVVAAPAAGTWYHIVFGYDNATQRSFWQVNAGARSFSNTVGIYAGVGGTLYLFAYTGGGTGPANGYLDEFGWWRRVLTTDEVTTLYNGGSGFGYPNFR